MQWLNYHHLYYFYVIASEGGVTEATKKLRLAQSTLSAQLKQFEESIGYKLFERKNRKLILTDVGKKVFEYAHEIFSLGEELRDSLGRFENLLQASLNVGIMDSIPKVLSRSLIKFVVDKYKAKVTIVEESLSSLMNKLTDHSIDLIFANDKPLTEGSKGRFHAKLIGELEVVFVSEPNLLSLREGFPRSINDQPFIMPGEHSPIRSEILDHFRIKNIQPEIIAEVDDLELQKMLAIDGHGVTALPLLACEKELRTGHLVRLSDTPICHENLWLISSHRLVQNPIAQSLLKDFSPSKMLS